MKNIQLTQNKYALVDDEDYQELNQYNWYAYKGNCTYYTTRRDNKLNKTISMHREIMKPFDNMQVDHINGNGLDNRKENLRICTGTQNQGNRNLNRNNKSGIKGVCWHKNSKKWRAQFNTNGKRKHLGYFKDKNEAKYAYTKAAKEYFGAFYSNGK